MKTKIYSIILLLSTLFGLMSCDKNISPDIIEPKGRVSFTAMSLDVDNAEKVISRAAGSVDVGSFLVTVASADGKTDLTYKYAELPEVLTLPVGEYTVTVRSHELQSAEWERPYFTGSTSFSVKADAVTEVAPVTCTFASLKVSVRYTERLRNLMGADCKVTVLTGTDGLLTYTPNEERPGYFAVVDGSRTLVATFAGTVAGNVMTLSKSYNNVEAGQHLILTFDAKTGNQTVPDEFGTVNASGVSIDVTVVEEDLTGNVDLPEDTTTPGKRPGEDDDEPAEPGDPDTPVTDAIRFTSNDVKFNEDADYTKPNGITGTSYVVHITSTEGIRNLNVTIDSSDQNFLAAVSDLLPLQFDLANPGAYDESFTSLGFPTGSKVVGAKELDFNITQFIPLLGTFPGTHQFILNVVDAKGNSSTRTLTFLAQ